MNKIGVLSILLNTAFILNIYKFKENIDTSNKKFCHVRRSRPLTIANNKLN